MTTSRGLFVSACFASSAAFASGNAETYGNDVRSQGKANAVVADESGPSAAFVNPAALARLKSPALHAGFQLSVPQTSIELDNPLEATNPLSPANPGPVAGIQLGFGAPLDLIVDDRVFIGFTAYVPSAVLVRARAHDPARPAFYLYDSTTEHYELFASLGVRITDWLAIGAGLRLGASQQGAASLVLDPVRGRFTQQDIDTSQTAVNAPIAGVLVGPFGIDAVKGRLGFVVRDRSSFDVDLPASLTISGLDAGLDVAIITLSNFSPRVFTGGVSVDVIDAVNVSVDVQYAQWSEAPSPFLQVTSDFGGNGLERLGLGDALDAPADGQSRIAPPGFVDTVNVRAGVEGRVLDDLVLLRAGYAWRPTPVPDQTSGTNIVDNSAHIVTAGAGVNMNLPLVAEKPFQMNIAYQTQILQSRDTEKESNRDPVGNYTSSGIVHSLGLDLRYVW